MQYRSLIKVMVHIHVQGPVTLELGSYKQPKEMNDIIMGMRLGVGWPILVSWYIALELSLVVLF